MSTDQHSVLLVPAGQFVATFYDGGGTSVCDTYVDITTTPTGDRSTLRMVDLDLDVVKGWTDRVRRSAVRRRSESSLAQHARDAMMAP